MITIDASVLVAAEAPGDPARNEAMALLAAILAAGSPIHQPTLSVVEVAAAITRRTGDVDLARDAGDALLDMPGLVLHPLDLESALEAAAMAGQLALRGADAIYAATAARLETTLITLDDELRLRTRPLVDAVTPAEWLERAG